MLIILVNSLKIIDLREWLWALVILVHKDIYYEYMYVIYKHCIFSSPQAEGSSELHIVLPFRFCPSSQERDINIFF